VYGFIYVNGEPIGQKMDAATISALLESLSSVEWVSLRISLLNAIKAFYQLYGVDPDRIFISDHDARVIVVDVPQSVFRFSILSGTSPHSTYIIAWGGQIKRALDAHEVSAEGLAQLAHNPEALSLLCTYLSQ